MASSLTIRTLAGLRLQSKYQGESGGLSVRPLRSRSETVLRQVVKRVNGKTPDRERRRDY